MHLSCTIPQAMQQAITSLTSVLTTHHASLTTITTTIRSPSTGMHTLHQTAQHMQDVGGTMLSTLRVLGRALMLRQVLADAVDSATHSLLPHVSWVCRFLGNKCFVFFLFVFVCLPSVCPPVFPTKTHPTHFNQVLDSVAVYRRDGALVNAGDVLGLPRPSTRAAVEQQRADSGDVGGRFLDPGLVAVLRGVCCGNRSWACICWHTCQSCVMVVGSR